MDESISYIFFQLSNSYFGLLDIFLSFDKPKKKIYIILIKKLYYNSIIKFVCYMNLYSSCGNIYLF